MWGVSYSQLGVLPGIHYIDGLATIDRLFSCVLIMIIAIVIRLRTIRFTNSEDASRRSNYCRKFNCDIRAFA